MATANRFTLAAMRQNQPNTMAAAPEPSWQDKLMNYSKDPNAARTEYQRASQVYNAKSAIGDTQGANAAKTWMGQVNTAAGGKAVPNPNDDVRQALQSYIERNNKPVTPFSYDPNTDASFQAQKAISEQDTQRGMNNARVEAGAVGMRGGSLQNNQLAQVFAQNQARLMNQVLPQYEQQAYQRYRDQQAQEQQQNQGMLQYASALGNLNQQQIANERAAAEDALRQRQANLNAYLSVGQATGYSPVEGPKEDWRLLFQGPGSDPTQFAPNLVGQKFKSDEAQQQFQRGVQEAGLTGSYNDKPTMQKLAQDFNQKQAMEQLAISRMNAGTSAAGQGITARRLAWDMDPNNPDNLYKTAQINKLNSTDKKINLNSAASSLSRQFTKKDEDGNIVVTDPQGLERAILSQPMSDDQYAYLYNYFGLNIPQ